MSPSNERRNISEQELANLLAQRDLERSSRGGLTTQIANVTIETDAPQGTSQLNPLHLVAYLNGKLPHDLATQVQAVLRSNLGMYRMMKRLAASKPNIVTSLSAAAANTSNHVKRMVGMYELAILEEGGLDYIIIKIPDKEPSPRQLNVLRDQDQFCGSLNLFDPIKGCVQHVLRSEDSDFLEALKDPSAEVRLIL